jgi:hypothetical protein
LQYAHVSDIIATLVNIPSRQFICTFLSLNKTGTAFLWNIIAIIAALRFAGCFFVYQLIGVIQNQSGCVIQRRA